MGIYFLSAWEGEGRVESKLQGKGSDGDKIISCGIGKHVQYAVALTQINVLQFFKNSQA